MLRFLIIALCSILSISYAEPIDIVYTWVDGSDKQWQETFVSYQQEAGHPVVLNPNRYRDREELRFSLRSINDFAPWFNHIYIVTCGQRPKWIEDNPKITFIDHKDIFTNQEDLPTFNSMAIESHLHNIPGLSEKYIYFNDDVFLGRPTDELTFFTAIGLTKVFLSNRKIPSSPPESGEEGFIAGSKNTAAILCQRFGEKKYYFHAHTPFPASKSFVQWVERSFRPIFESVSSHRFRAINDYTITNGLIPFSSLEKGVGEVWDITNDRTTVGYGKDPIEDQRQLESILSQHPCFFCIQDSSSADDPEATQKLHDFFVAYFPNPAPWERLEETESTIVQETKGLP